MTAQAEANLNPSTQYIDPETGRLTRQGYELLNLILRTIDQKQDA